MRQKESRDEDGDQDDDEADIILMIFFGSRVQKNESERQYLSSLTAFLLSALFASLLRPGMLERHVRTTQEQEKIPKTIESIVFSFSCLEST